jgi:hypothetical protein
MLMQVKEFHLTPRMACCPVNVCDINLMVTGKSLEEQGVSHNVKAMVLELKQSEEDVRKNSQVEEEEQNEAELKEKQIQRTKRGLEILAERGTHSLGLVTSLVHEGGHEPHE